MKKAFRVASTLVGYILFEFILAMVGLFVGAMIGGNFLNEFVYQGLPGYEGVGVLGMHIAIVIGLILIIVHALRMFRKQPNSLGRMYSDEKLVSTPL